MTDSNAFVPLQFHRLNDDLMLRYSQQFQAMMSTRRTVRHFSTQIVDDEIVLNAIRAAGTAPSGANMQPWQFVLIKDPIVRSQIRDAAEAEESELYEHRASQQWLDALAPLGTDAHKPFLEDAPVLIAIFQKKFTIDKDGKRLKNYYPSESVGIATGILITALHQAGLATLTHTPSPMNFLNQILSRPLHEKPFLLLVAGLPSEHAEVPNIERRIFEDICTIV
ncbi:MAG: nitroreductase family protein [bacterium]